MIGSNRRTRQAVLGVVIAMAAGAPSTGLGQLAIRGSSYEQDLLRRIDLMGALPQDGPRLAHLVVLNTISMDYHARLQLGSSPAGARLAAQIDGLWQAAATFDQVARATEATLPVAEPPGVAFARLDDAFAPIESTLGAIPGQAPGASYRLDRVTRLLSVLRPQLGAAGAVSVPSPAVSGPSEEIRRDTRDLGRRLAGLRDQLGPAGPENLAGRVGELADVVRQFDGIVAGAPSPEGLRTGFRPVRLRAGEIDALVRGGPAPEATRARWAAIRGEVDRLSARFGFPREIILRPATSAAPDPRPHSLPPTP
jgi:hypothetical protein